MHTPTYDKRQSTIVDVARAIVAGHGPEAVTMSALAEGTGLSRPAIYQYFSSSAHVLGELVLNDMADLSNEVERIVGAIDEPTEQIRAWIHYCLAYLSTGEHQAIMTIGRSSLPEEHLGVVKAMHGFFMEQLVRPLDQLGVEDARSLCGMIYGAVSAAAGRIAEGGEFLTEARLLETFVDAGLESTLANRQAHLPAAD
ncbi:AcrR-like transcription factor [Pontimonas salivibrio]|uniref:AcrR-like transcription factor n=1 Tax=Pontimonas salivibrio TaxID=1159327 RepID=A0A2L2BQC2_9MICO|nr:TetR/AcrR family transcriptional regulator [Pontimonas salivibrio]AVG23848.1 AcrR-like transcription factor [Pontimonas salivibrio]